jgi:hypothetical protein
MIALSVIMMMFFASTYLLSSKLDVDGTNNSHKVNRYMIPSKAHHHGHPVLEDQRQDSPAPLTVYLEQPTTSRYPNGTAIKPLPVRTVPSLLRKILYPNVRSCDDLPHHWPIHHPVSMDDEFGPNVGTLFSIFPLREKYAASVCPVDADPYLPWIFDVFVSHDGQFVDFVAANKRRCRTSFNFLDDLHNLEPQVSLFQSVPVQRVDDQDNHDTYNADPSIPRYRLSSYEDASVDGKETRFICRFHSSSKFVAETLSVFPYNYEYANKRKGGKMTMLSTPKDKDDRHGAHNEAVWNSQLHFRCPVPQIVKQMIEGGANIDHLKLDLITIRTPPRTDETYFPQAKSDFDPKVEWGNNYILPRVEDSGRIANIPICQIPKSTSDKTTTTTKERLQQDGSIQRPYFLIGCMWTSAAFSTRGDVSKKDTSSSQRLFEWLTYHLYIAGFDHVYVYDNTDPESGTSLQPIIDKFPNDRVTRIIWPARVCNNNRPMHVNPGERSSQYSAESSCRLRYGPLSHWIANMDVDEYLIPQKKWTSIQEWLLDAEKKHPETKIYSFYQTRAVPNAALMDPHSDSGNGCASDSCLVKRQNRTFLQTYDCEKTPLPKPDYGWRAKKQIYDPKHVLNHFVHYSLVSDRILTMNEPSNAFNAAIPFERRVNELEDAFMLHTKTTYPEMTRRWQHDCRAENDNSKDNCPVGIPYELDTAETSGGADPSSPSNHTLLNGMLMRRNCWKHKRIQEDLVPRLQQLLGLN